MIHTFNATVTIDVDNMAELHSMLQRREYTVELLAPSQFGCPWVVNIRHLP